MLYAQTRPPNAAGFSFWTALSIFARRSPAFAGFLLQEHPMSEHHTPSCLVCKLDMEPGFLTDLGHGNNVNLPRWCAGEQHGGVLSPMFGEASRSQRREGLQVTAYRCPACHALRLYAFDAPID